MRTKSAETDANVTRSVALTLNSRLLMTRVIANDATNPTPTPIKASFIPCPTTIAVTSRVSAPRAMRTPISLVRCATPYDITPYRPTAPKEFYRALGEGDPAEALATAQRAMMRHPRYRAPFYWAAYQVAGEGLTTFGRRN